MEQFLYIHASCTLRHLLDIPACNLFVGPVKRICPPDNELLLISARSKSVFRAHASRTPLNTVTGSRCFGIAVDRVRVHRENMLYTPSTCMHGCCTRMYRVIYPRNETVCTEDGLIKMLGNTVVGIVEDAFEEFQINTFESE